MVLEITSDWHDLRLEPAFVRDDDRGFVMWGKRAVHLATSNLGRIHTGGGGIRLEVELVDEVVWNGGRVGSVADG